MSQHDSIADVLLGGLAAEDRSTVVERLREAADDERAAAEAGQPRPFPGPARPAPRRTAESASGVILTDAELERVAGAPWRGGS
jgi:hypothetical protein